ncbi:LysR family transcriptional regulator [Luteimonas sp. R10]|uniref:LysR family transcriptional regulator n=1 Tax=Luteimonas sp. R10 TaxID=3108176 RepID=UPI003084A4C3|nr:LysR family transcriptional regulator [Luteimonas sp. R10]
MRLRHIELFSAILQTRTLTGAAQLLNISQPAATKLLQQVERQLGFPLFIRVHGRLQLTEEGHALKERTEKISDDLRDLQRLSANLRQSSQQLLRVVGTFTLASALIPRAIAAMPPAFREASIELSAHHSREMLSWVLLHEADIGLTLHEMAHPGIRQQLIGAVQLMVIAPRGWWAPEEMSRPLPLAELSEMPIIGIATSDSLGRVVRGQFERIDPQPRIRTWVHTPKIARALVASRQGLALVDAFTALDNNDGEVDARLVSPEFELPLYAVMRKEDTPTAIQRAFLTQIAPQLPTRIHVAAMPQDPQHTELSTGERRAIE